MGQLGRLMWSCTLALCAGGAAAVDLAFVSNRTGDAQIYFKAGAEPESAITQGPGGNSQPAWSPDGRLLAFVSTRSSMPRIVVSDASGGGQKRVVAEDGWIETAPSWSPDGKRLAFYAVRVADGEVALRIVDIASSAIVSVVGNGRDKGPSPASWSADGKRLAFMQLNNESRGRPDVVVVDADGSNLRVVGAKAGNRAKADPMMSPDGKAVVFVVDTRNTIDVVTAPIDDPNAFTNLTQGKHGNCETPRWSADGKTIVFASTGPQGARMDIYAMQADGTGLRNLTSTPDDEEFFPRWAADGNEVLFVRLLGGASRLYAVSTQGDGAAVELTAGKAFDTEPAPRPVRGKQ